MGSKMAVDARARAFGESRTGWGPWIDQHALALWPRLGRRAISRCGHDPRCIASVVARRTSLPRDLIERILVTPSVTIVEAETWFG
jgi:hypothetical protein